MGDVALAGERHTQRAMDEEFDGRIGLVGDGANLLQIQLAGQYQLGEARLVKKLRPCQGADVGLGAGVQLDRRNIQLHHAKVLDDQRIDAGIVELMDQLAGWLQLIVMQDRVDRREHPGVVAPGELHQSGDLTHFVTGIVAGAEARSTDINGVGTMQDRLASDAHVTGRAEQFQVMFGQGHIFYLVCHGRGTHCSGQMFDRHPWASWSGLISPACNKPKGASEPQKRQHHPSRLRR
ncbi:hypothetical protein D3C84_789810 [compost metagenome]